ncbi:MAG: pyridoxal phosphate-dependent aminotransferase [bacterium]|jgi:aspartate aminotransferase
MALLSKRLNLFTESQTLKMAKLSRELKNKGVDIINLTLGEPDFTTPIHIKEAAKKAIDNNFSYYTPVVGYLDLREAICRKFKRENNLDYTPEQIVVSTGAKQSIANALLSTIDAGDEVLIPTPYWVSYSEMVKLAEGIPVFIDATIENNFKITADQLEQAITNKTKLLIFSSPCNPSGTVYTKDELAAFAKIFEKHPNIWIISDEIYEHINYLSNHESIAQFDSIKERVIIINGLSKAFAMTGWRLGYMAASIELAKACDKMQGQFTSATSSISQRAAIEALDGDIKPTLEMKAAYQKRRDTVYNLLKDIPGIKTNLPDGAFYFFPDVSSYFGKSYNGTIINNAEDLCMFILNDTHVSLVTGSAFGSNNNIRFSYATSEDILIEGMKRIKESLLKLK